MFKIEPGYTISNKDIADDADSLKSITKLPTDWKFKTFIVKILLVINYSL